MSEVMKPDPIAWVYQNANTEHQYLVWHKQEGGRNWTPLFTLQDVQDAILAEREKVAQWMTRQGYATGHGDNIEDLLKELEWQIEERIRREWVGLTADEIWKCNKASGSAVEFHICYEHQNVLDFAEAIEAKLKEKNT